VASVARIWMDDGRTRLRAASDDTVLDA
jgi:hypothetical protein